MHGIKQEQYNLFVIALNFAQRLAEQINNCNIEIMKIEQSNGSQERLLELRAQKDQLEEKMKKYNAVIDQFDQEYFS
jgi:uncharacterized protein YdcH (DUF465 family)